jgi:hypothetical protein
VGGEPKQTVAEFLIEAGGCNCGLWLLVSGVGMFDKLQFVVV